MALTARSLISSSLRLLGVLAAGERPSAQEADDALQTLNQLLDSWSLERLLIYMIERLDVPLVAGTAVYTWGQPGGDIPQPRPVQVEGVLLRVVDQDLEWPLEALSQADYEAIGLKQLTSLYPQSWVYEPTYPLGTLTVWPAPEATNALGVFPWVPLSRFASLDTVVSLPEGYERLLRAGVAVDLSPEYGREVSLTIAGMLAEAKSSVKRTNTVVPRLGMDGAVAGRGQGAWWWQTGTVMRRR
jgi:hypothetical protein